MSMTTPEVPGLPGALPRESAASGAPNSTSLPTNQFFNSAAMERVHQIRAGVPASRIADLSASLGLTKETLVRTLGFARATINRKISRDELLSRADTELVLGVQALLNQVRKMLSQSADEAAVEFDAGRWLGLWLGENVPALGGPPMDFLDTVEGQKMVAQVLSMMQSGAYA